MDVSRAIGQHERRLAAQERGEGEQLERRVHGVPSPDIEVQRELCPAQRRRGVEPHGLIAPFVADRLDAEAGRLEAQPVVRIVEAQAGAHGGRDVLFG